MFSTPHLLLTSSLVILSCHLTLDVYYSAKVVYLSSCLCPTWPLPQLTNQYHQSNFDLGLSRKWGWLDLPHSNSNLSNSHSSSRSIQGILLLQTNTLAVLLHLRLPLLLWSSSLPLALHFKLQCFSQNMPTIPPQHMPIPSHSIRLCHLNHCFHQSQPLHWGLFKRIKHVGQTLSNIVRWCWTVFDQCWIVLDAWVFKRIQHHPTMLDFSTRHKIMVYFWKCFSQNMPIIPPQHMPISV